MQCFEYLAIQHYARRNLGEWARKRDDLDLAEALDEKQVESLSDIDGLDTEQTLSARPRVVTTESTKTRA